MPKSNLSKGRIAVLSSIAAANAFVQLRAYYWLLVFNVA